MLDVGMLRAFVARAANPTDGSLAGLLEALDVLAARLVLSAIGGDMRAANMIANLIDGPARRLYPVAMFSKTPPGTGSLGGGDSPFNSISAKIIRIAFSICFLCLAVSSYEEVLGSTADGVRTHP